MEPLEIFVTGLQPDAEKALLTSLSDLKPGRLPQPPAQVTDAARPPLAVVGLNGNAESAFATVSRLAAAGVRVAVVGATQDADTILRAMRAGAREFAVAGDARRLEAAVRNLARPASDGATARVTAVFPAKGGMGATTIGANLAATLASRGERVCLLDLDLQLGDVRAFLDVAGGYSVADVVANMRRLDRDLLDASIATHRSGVHVVAQGERLEEAEQIDTASVEKLLGFLRQHYAHVIVDGLRRFDELALATLDASDRILLLVTQEVPSVRNAQRCMDIFRKLTYPDERTALVVNRYLKASNITAQVIGETLGIPVTGTIANDFAATSRAVHRGATLIEEAPRSPIVRDLQALAAVIGGEAKGARSGGMLRRLFARG